MTTHSGDNDPDAPWRRPSGQPEGASDQPPPHDRAGGSGYPGGPGDSGSAGLGSGGPGNSGSAGGPGNSGWAGGPDSGWAGPGEPNSRGAGSGSVGRAGGVGYSGPPRTTPPPPGWRPPVHVEPPPPRQLPEQDRAGLDLAERDARRITIGVASVAGAILLVVVCLLCSRLLF